MKKLFNGQHAVNKDNERLWIPSGKYSWLKVDGTTTCTFKLHEDKKYFSLILATWVAREQ
jgi:hypothetical protein